jgi:Zn-finger nucleic acid-binding protein
MMKKICPVCDLPLNEINYCPRCRRVVKNPFYWEVDYLLNEKRNQAVMPVNQPAAAKAPVNQSNVHTSLPGKGNSNVLLFVIVLFIVIITLASVMISCAVNATSLENNYETAVGYDDYGYRDLDEAEVLAAGEHCSGFDHFDTDGREISRSMVQFLEKEEYGYGISSQETYGDNYEFKQDGDPLTFYETVESVYLEARTSDEVNSGEEDYEYVDINYDTATGELHRYVSYLKDQEATLAYLKQFLLYTEAGCKVAPDQSSAESIVEQAQARLNQQEGAYILEGIFDVSIYIYEDRIQVYVSYNNPETVINQET